MFNINDDWAYRNHAVSFMFASSALIRMDLAWAPDNAVLLIGAGG